MRSTKAPLVEIFHSIQGEGRHVGEAMAFVRVAACPLRCTYCDTPGSYEAAPRFRVGLGAADRLEANPVEATRAFALVRECVAASRYGAGGAGEPLRISVTGGEPLLYPGFVRALGEAAHAEGARVHLETAASDGAALAEALPGVDHLSADWKLPSTIGTSAYEREHVACVELALRAGRAVDVKLVLPPAAVAAETARALAALAPFRAQILLVIQPVTPFGAVTAAPTRAELADLVAAARAAGFAVRLIPQTHKMLGIE